MENDREGMVLRRAHIVRPFPLHRHKMLEKMIEWQRCSRRVRQGEMRRSRKRRCPTVFVQSIHMQRGRNSRKDAQFAIFNLHLDTFPKGCYYLTVLKHTVQLIHSQINKRKGGASGD